MRAANPKRPIAAAPDVTIERRASDLTHLVKSFTGVECDTGALASALAAPGVLTHDTLRTSALPGRELGHGVTYAERARTLGRATLADGSINPTAYYEPTADGPQGAPESLAARRKLLASIISTIPPHRSQGLPGSKRARRAARAAKHNATKGK